MSEQKSFLSRVFNFKESMPTQEQTPEKTIVIQTEALGSSGTEIYAGYISEEYLETLTGSERACLFDKMRRGDARVKMCLSAVKNPIRSASWEWHAGSDGEEFQKHADFVEYVIFKNSKKKKRDLKNELMSVADFGHAVFERVHQNVMNDKAWGSFTGLKSLGWRSPKTLERFNVDKDSGDLKTVTQIVSGDLSRSVDMDARFLTVMSLDKEGDNYEGVSMLRPCYGAWQRKQVYLKLMAIGIEKFAVPAPIAEVPEGKENSKQYEMLIKALKKYTSHQSNYLTYPQGWKIEVKANPFDPEKVKKAIDFENTEMTFAFLANFLELGQGGGGGSYALSNDLSDFFLGGLEYIAETICDALNEVAKELIDLNFGPQEFYPELKITGISDKAGKEFAEVLGILRQHDYLVPDDNIEISLRKRLGLPEMKEDDRRAKSQSPSFGAPPPQDPLPSDEKKSPLLNETSLVQTRIMLAEGKIQKEIEKHSDGLKEILQKHLKIASESLKKDLVKEYKSLPDSSKVNAVKGVSAKKTKAFRDDLKKALAEMAFQALDQAKKEVPKAKDVKLTEKIDSIQLREFEDLPLVIRRLLLTQSGLLVDTTINDLDKATLFAFSDSVNSTDSLRIIESDIDDATQKVIEGSSVRVAAANVAARVVNESRNAFFFDSRVLQEIESFTFVNGDPKSAICQDLAGTTFPKNDPMASRYYPPLHHNCKSILVPNLVGARNNPKVSESGLRPSSPKLEKEITLKEMSI